MFSSAHISYRTTPHLQPFNLLPTFQQGLCRETTAALASSTGHSIPISTPTSSRSRTRTHPPAAPPLFTSTSSPSAIPPPSYNDATSPTASSTAARSASAQPSPPSPSSPPPSPSAHDASHRHKIPADRILLSRKRLDSAGQHPRVAALLGVQPGWYVPLLICRALSCAPAAWWGFRCALTFLGELILRHGRGLTVLEPGSENYTGPGVAGVAGGGTTISVRGSGWAEAERRFRVTEVFLAILWCSASAYLSFFFTDCLMTRWLVNYTPFATVMRLLTLNALIAYISSLSMWLSGASEDPRMLLPAWISIATLLTLIYHITQRKINIRKETHATIHIFSFASFISLCAVLFQLHLARENDPVVPIFEMAKQVWKRLHIGKDSTYGKSDL